MKHMIIGVGAAGITAAMTIRERKPSDEIVMVSVDEAVHSRCMLHYYISGKRDIPALSFVPKGFFEENKIRWIAGKAITGIDTAAKTVDISGQKETYDTLLIATGSKSFFPPIEGLAGLDNVYGLRNLSDAVVIKEKVQPGSDIVILGAGLVGIDAAYAFLEMNKNGAGLKPVVVEAAESILPLNLDVDASKPYLEKFKEEGCAFRLGRKVTKVTGDGNGSVKSVILDDGEELPCKLLILATGTRPNTAFLEGSGIVLTDRGGVKVNELMATNTAGVYAAGDVTGLSGDWPSARSQGDIAAMNMCGESVVYEPFPFKNTLHFFGIPALSLGQAMPSEGDDVKCRYDRKRYEKIILRDGIPVGVILRGDISNSGFWQHLVKNKMEISHVSKPVWKISFADGYGVTENGEYRWQSQ